MQFVVRFSRRELVIGKHMVQDSELLRRYADEGSEPAFHELVQRRVNLVFATALRVTNDAHAADDITQTVFAAMAQKARTLLHHPALSGWLHRSARYTAINVLQQKRRRAEIEREAFAVTATHQPTPDHSVEDNIAPLIDELLDRLSERERLAVLLRFFEECSFNEIGARLRLKEDAARMCVARALEKLRSSLARRGISSTTTALTALLAHHAATAAPAGLAAIASGAALSAASGAAVAGFSPLLFMATNTKVIVAGVAIAGLGVMFYEAETNRALQKRLGAMQTQLATDQAKARADAAVLDRMRAELAALRSKPAPAARSPSSPLAASPAPQLPPITKQFPVLIETLRNSGRASPAAAFETLFWALRKGLPDEAAALVQFAGEDGTGLKAVFDSLSPSARERFVNPGFMFIAVTLSQQGVPPFAGVELVDETMPTPDEALLRYHWVDDSRIRTMPLRRIDGAWTLIVSGLGLTERQAMWKELAQSTADEIERRGPNNAETKTPN